MRFFVMRFFVAIVSALFFSSCQRSSGSTWEDTKTLGRYIQRGSKLLFKQNPDSKLIHDGHEFQGPVDDDFIPLNQDELQSVAAAKSANANQPATETVSIKQEAPMAREDLIPKIESFKNPSKNLASIFRTVHFNTDDFILRENTSLAVVDSITSYMKAHPNLYLFVLGHCDERASESYNLSLGAKRASYVRNLLIKKGIDPNHIFTISLGKEMPLDALHTKEAWAKNRRAEFKIYEKGSAQLE